MSGAGEVVPTVVTGSSDPRLWLVAIVSGLSLLWNLCNSIYTARTSKKLRREAVRLEEFRETVRDPILVALAVCEDKGSRAAAASQSALTVDEMEDDLRDLNRELIAALTQLSDKLSDADASKFASDTNWLEDFEEWEDSILLSSSSAQDNSQSDDDRRLALEAIQTEIKRARRAIRKRLEQEVERLS